MMPAYITATRSASDDTTAEIVRDPDHCRAVPAAELLRLVQDLRLDRHVQRRRRLVGDHQIGLVDEGDRDRHALTHATG